jgi:protein-disulfide isomerase
MSVIRFSAAGAALLFLLACGEAPPPSAAREVARSDAPLREPSRAAQPTLQAEEAYRVPLGGSPSRGPEDALITIVEFADFKCPFCARASQTVKQLEEEYKGKVRLVFKQNPLPMHAHARAAAELALAAADQGRFWPMHDRLFEAGSHGGLVEAELARHAQELGLDPARFRSFIESGRAKSIIESDQALATKLGATGTPAFFINGVRLTGAQPAATFRTLIDAQLEKISQLLQKGVSRSDIYAKLQDGLKDCAPPQVSDPAPPARREAVALAPGAPTRGGKEPLVTIVLWSDYECPFCARVEPTLRAVLEGYGDKVAVQFRNQPLPMHPSAIPAARAALAAGLQGRFWAMHDKLFENQGAQKDEDLLRYATELGLDVPRWKAELGSPEVERALAQDRADAEKHGVRGTPTLFVNGMKVAGAQPLPAVKALVDAELEAAEKLVAGGVPRASVYAEVLARAQRQTP